MKVVLAAVLGAIAIGVAASPANAAQEWLIEGQTLAELKLSEETFEVSSKAPTVLSVPGFKLVLKCKTTKGSGKILAKAGAELSLSLTGCEAVELPACTVKEPVTITAKTKVAPTSTAFHEKFEQPKEKTPFTKLKFGELCPLPEEAELKGAIAGELPAEETVEPVIKVSEAVTKKVNEELKTGGASEYSLLYGIKPATMSGEFMMKLTGKAGSGKAWLPQPATVLCSVPPVGNNEECPVGKSYGVSTIVKPETLEGEKVAWEFTLAGNNKVVACDALRMEGPTTPVQTLVNVSISSVSFGANCTGGCTVTTLDTPWVSYIVRLPFPRIFIDNPGFKFDCGTNEICKYKISVIASGRVEGGAPAGFEFPEWLLDRYSATETACSARASWKNEAGGSLRFKFWEPAPLYIGYCPTTPC
ncbi:MAG TPA: hypothetical protein VH042_04195 [Solirubrobacterales bacterium]|jgi:hypothetical protein|nr:hypothetical protein [Solirubrobacterales bacterium]